MEKKLIDDIKEKLNGASKLLIGLGSNVILSDDEREYFNTLIKDKDYYVISLSESKDININCDENKTVFPFVDDEEKWENYLKWLQNTLNKELLIIELGASFLNPEVIRFPFEKTCLYNNKAYLVRVNSVFYQIPEEINQKSIGIKMEVGTFLRELS